MKFTINKRSAEYAPEFNIQPFSNKNGANDRRIKQAGKESEFSFWGRAKKKIEENGEIYDIKFLYFVLSFSLFLDLINGSLSNRQTDERTNTKTQGDW